MPRLLEKVVEGRRGDGVPGRRIWGNEGQREVEAELCGLTKGCQRQGVEAGEAAEMGGQGSGGL